MNPCCPVSVSACVSLSKVGKLCGATDPDDDPDVKGAKNLQGSNEDANYFC